MATETHTARRPVLAVLPRITGLLNRAGFRQAASEQLRVNPRSVVLRNRPRTAYTFGPRYGANCSEPASVSVTTTYAAGDSAALRSGT